MAPGIARLAEALGEDGGSGGGWIREEDPLLVAAPPITASLEPIIPEGEVEERAMSSRAPPLPPIPGDPGPGDEWGPPGGRSPPPASAPPGEVRSTTRSDDPIAMNRAAVSAIWADARLRRGTEVAARAC